MRTTLLALCLAACTTEPPAPSVPDPAAPVDLVLDTNTPTHVAGTLHRDRRTFAFDFTRTGDAEHAVITAEDGAPLADAIIQDDGTHDTILMGGRLHVDGSLTGEPIYDGDRSVFAELDKLPLADLEPALNEVGIEPNLRPTKAALGAHPDDASCGRLMHVNQTDVCGSVFFGYTSIWFENYDWYPMEGNFNGDPTLLGGYYNYPPETQDHGGWWWGQNVYATNYGYCPAGWCGTYNFWDPYANMVLTH